MPDDMYSLEVWLREKALYMSNKKYYYQQERDAEACEYYDIKLQAFNEVITKIQNARASQRPHVTITEEFDVR